MYMKQQRRREILNTFISIFVTKKDKISGELEIRM